MTERDTTIDALRGAAMIYMVCIIHVVYWFSPTPEPFSSVLLFEMPAVFFIAGAAQSLRRGPLPSMKKMAAGRARRVLLPFAFFLPWLFLWLLLISAVEPADSMFNFSIGSLAWTDYAKILLTFGGDKIPYYQYTWFIPCYFVLLCSFPLQARVARSVGRGFYAVAVLADEALWRGQDPARFDTCATFRASALCLERTYRHRLAAMDSIVAAIRRR